MNAEQLRQKIEEEERRILVVLEHHPTTKNWPLSERRYLAEVLASHQVRNRVMIDQERVKPLVDALEDIRATLLAPIPLGPRLHLKWSNTLIFRIQAALHAEEERA